MAKNKKPTVKTYTGNTIVYDPYVVTTTTGTGLSKWPNNMSDCWTYSPITYNPITVAKNRYSIFELPEERIPYKVYMDGRMLTLGMFGSDVEAAFCKTPCRLILSPEVARGAMSVSIEYKKHIYHYKLKSAPMGSAYKEKSFILDAKLVSKIKK